MKKTIKCLIIVLVGSLFAFLISVARGLFSAEGASAVYHILCDGFTVVGFAFTGFGLLLFVSNEGAFDGLAFCLRSFFGMFRKNYAREGYYDYKERRASKKMSFSSLLISGLVIILVAVIIYILYSNSLKV